MITRNSVRCHKCNDEIESKSRHDFVFCSCGNIAVDGGKDYLKRVGNGLKDESFTDTSTETSKPIKQESRSQLRTAILSMVKGKIRKMQDYEPCGQCGFDHAYEQKEASKIHHE